MRPRSCKINSGHKQRKCGVGRIQRVNTHKALDSVPIIKVLNKLVLSSFMPCIHSSTTTVSQTMCLLKHTTTHVHSRTRTVGKCLLRQLFYFTISESYFTNILFLEFTDYILIFCNFHMLINRLENFSGKNLCSRDGTNTYRNSQNIS